MDCSEDKSKDNSDPNATVGQDAVVRTTVKKKVIKRVPKKKVTVEEASKKGEDGDGSEKKVTTDETQNVEKSTTDDKQEKIPKSKSISPTMLKRRDSVNLKKGEKEPVKNDKETGKEIGPVTNLADKQKVGEKDSSDGKREKSKDGEQSKDEKEKMGKDESRSKPNKESKEKRKSEEPPRHPGLILQTKWSKDSKCRSLSLSLDSLLEYTDKDIEESTFELSLFAESLYEMLQYQMGSRILTFLQKLRVKFVAKRNQRKRQREEIHKEDNKKSSPKRPKTTDIPIENKSVEPESLSLSQADAGTPAVEGNDSAGHVDETKMETETDYGEEPEEDPEEDPEEYEELDDTSSQHNSSNENEADATVETNDEEDTTMGTNEEDAKTELNEEAKTAAANVEPENVAGSQREEEAKGSNPEGVSKKTTESDKRGVEVEMKKKEVSPPKEAVVDKELLQAFRFFDRNLVGYIRVEDMRMVIHNMGKFLSHRDVKELVHSALLESNTGRDDRILYGKLVRMSDI